MEAYLASLNSSNNLDRMNEEWIIYRDTHYPYEERNYMTELEEMELAENRASLIKRPDHEVLDCIRQRMFHFKKPRDECICSRDYFGNREECVCGIPYTAEEIKKRIYGEWLFHKKKFFKKNWKPNQEDKGLGYMHLTFNFHPDTDINVFKLDMSRIVNLAVFDDCNLTYSYEYYGSNKCHPHCHMLVELTRTGTKSKSTIEEKVFQMKKLKEYMSIQFQFSWANKDSFKVRSRAVTLAYIQGKKTEDKIEQVEKDKLWRQLNNIEDIYFRPAKK